MTAAIPERATPVVAGGLLALGGLLVVFGAGGMRSRHAGGVLDRGRLRTPSHDPDQTRRFFPPPGQNPIRYRRQVDLETAARLLGVHYQTAYRWVRAGMLPAVKVGGGYEVAPEDVDRLAEARRMYASPRHRGSVDWEKLTEHVFSAVTGGDELEAHAVVEGLLTDGISPLQLCESLVGPVLRRFSTDSGDELLGARAALAAGICERVLGMLAVAPRGRPRGLAIAASPEHDLHRLPSLMATVVLRADRWRVHHLGAGVPVRDIVDSAIAAKADLVVISVAFAGGSEAAVREELADTLRIPVLLGGPEASLAQLLDQARATRRR